MKLLERHLEVIVDNPSALSDAQLEKLSTDIENKCNDFLFDLLDKASEEVPESLITARFNGGA